VLASGKQYSFYYYILLVLQPAHTQLTSILRMAYCLAPYNGGQGMPYCLTPCYIPTTCHPEGRRCTFGRRLPCIHALHACPASVRHYFSLPCVGGCVLIYVHRTYYYYYYTSVRSSN
jgi:hypothetical protein